MCETGREDSALHWKQDFTDWGILKIHIESLDKQCSTHTHTQILHTHTHTDTQKHTHKLYKNLIQQFYYKIQN